jgi:hypothetical protein
MRLLERNHPDSQTQLMKRLEAQIVEAAGRLRLESAILILVGHVLFGGDTLLDESVAALRAIGTDAVVRALAGSWCPQKTL